jgi:hypothetical protein
MARINDALACLMRMKTHLAAIRENHKLSMLTLLAVEAEVDEAMYHLKGEAAGKPVSFGTYVKMKQEEYDRLVSAYGKSKVDAMIVDMDDYCGAKGVKYKDYNRALHQWFNRREREKDEKATAPDKKTPLYTG